MLIVRNLFMKKSLLIFSIFSCICFQAQTYHFDFLTKYSSTSSKTTAERVRYHNTDDFSYFLNLYKSVRDFTAILYDRKNNLMHHFSVVESKKAQDIEFSFSYSYSEKSNFQRPSNYRFEISEISASPKIFSLKTYTSKRAKKPFSECIMTLRKANKNLMQLYGSDAVLWNNETKDLAEIGKNIITEAREKYQNTSFDVILKEYKNVNFQITLPNELQF